MSANTLKHAFFYNSERGDRVYDADSFSEWLRKFFTTGVFTGDLQVVEGTGMSIAVNPGYANINGKVKMWQQSTTLDISTANSRYDRVDTVVIERNDTARDFEIKVVTGAATDQPTPTAPVRENEIYQLVLAQIRVRAGATEVTQADITDKRADRTVCGFVAATVEQIDFTQIQAQFDGYMKEYQKAVDAWFEGMKGQLSTDAAVNLQNQIGTLALLKTKAKTDLVAAVNEVFEKTTDVLNTKEEIEANKDPKAIAGALAVKELSNDLKKVNVYVGEDKKLHFTDSEGADSVIPFNAMASGEFKANTDAKKINCGFRPKLLVIYNSNTGRGDLLLYEASLIDKAFVGYHNSLTHLHYFNGNAVESGSANYQNMKFAIHNDGFTFGNIVAYDADIMKWFAV